MRKMIIEILLVFVLLAGCQFEGPYSARLRREEEQHQRLMKLYDLQAKMVGAKLAGDTNITDADLAAINTSINEIKAQQQQQKTQQTLQGIEDELKKINTYNRYGY
ncbi:MAG: hypothetical protein ABIL62_07790 [Planctomycetota bacterium]